MFARASTQDGAGHLDSLDLHAADQLVHAESVRVCVSNASLHPRRCAVVGGLDCWLLLCRSQVPSQRNRDCPARMSEPRLYAYFYLCRTGSWTIPLSRAQAPRFANPHVASAFPHPRSTRVRVLYVRMTRSLSFLYLLSFRMPYTLQHSRQRAMATQPLAHSRTISAWRSIVQGSRPRWR